MREISHDELGDLLRGRMGLIVGPAITQHSGSLSEFAHSLAKELEVQPSDDYRDVADLAIESDKSVDAIREAAHSLLGSARPSAFTAHLAKGKWSAILSACTETFLEDKMQVESEKHPSRRPIVVMNDLSMSLPPRSIPVFKLLGIASRDDFALTTASYISRKITWRNCLTKFADHVKGNPLLCVGMSDCPAILIDLIGELMADRQACPEYLLLLSDDPLKENRQLVELAQPRIKIRCLPGTVGEVVRTISQSEKSGFTLTLPFGKDADISLEKLSEFEEVCTVVNTQLESQFSIDQSHLLQDILFAPSIPRWDPYVHGLDFERTLTGSIFSMVSSHILSKQTSDFATVVSGNAASGKTTILKSLALRLARDDNFVIWLRPTFAPDPLRVIRQLFSELAAFRSDFPNGVVCFLDDPVSFGSLTTEDIVSAARNANIRLALIIGVRKTDSATIDSARLYGTCPVLIQEELSDTFDEAEWEKLPGYLVRLGICSDFGAATSICRKNESRAARDTLCMMYLLVYGTRETISSSIRAEYFRLGDTADFARIVLGARDQSVEILKRAYEMVAVSDYYRTPLPIEVLVASLEIDYAEWLDASTAEGPAWGILYSDVDQDGSMVYRTRNFVVTNTLIVTLNGGSFGHSGELRVLQTLINGCQGRGSAVYREFLARLLIANDRLSHLEFAEGLDLYNSAIDALPHSDRTLLHHKGLWIKNRGHNPLQAMEVFAEALNADVYPYAERAEAKEHIHTSYAAAAVDAIDTGDLDVEVGKNRVLDHLSKARSSDFFNPKAIHVQGSLVLRLVKKLDSSDAVDCFALLNQALSDIDRTLLLLLSPIVPSTGTDEALQDMMAKLFLAASHVDDLSEAASRLWINFRNQEGFVLLIRKKLHEARESGRGRLFKKAFDNYLEVVRKVENGKAIPVAALHEVALDIQYYWHIHHAAPRSQVDWILIETLATRAISERPPERQSVLHRFLLALALGQQQKWAEALQIYSSLRRSNLPRDLLWTPRCYLVDEKNAPRLLQATMQRSSIRWFAYVEELGQDFHTNGRENWPREGEICHVYLRFSFGGPTATKKLS